MGLGYLGQTFPKLTCLTELCLDFEESVNLSQPEKKNYLNRCEGITDAGLGCLGQGFRTLTSLTNLSLNLTGFEHLLQ